MTKNAKYPAIVGAIIAGILVVEGGYVNHPSDPGGETNYGITKRTSLANWNFRPPDPPLIINKL